MAKHTAKKLTPTEIDMLVRALSAYARLRESEATSPLIMGAIGITPDQVEEYTREINEQVAEIQEQMDLLHESVILLQAKLIQMKDENLLRDVYEFMEKGEGRKRPQFRPGDDLLAPVGG